MTTPSDKWANIPLELRSRPQWLLASKDSKGFYKVPMTVNADGTLAPGSSTNRATWLPFDVAVSHAQVRGLGIGYVMAHDDPYCVVDLDVKNQNNEPDSTKWTTREQIERFVSIGRHLNCYTERSTSGQGLHIWCRGKIGLGVKRDGVEVYSQERFVVCTGDVFVNEGLHDRQDMLNNMVSQMRQGQQRDSELTEVDPVDDDPTVWERAANAANADKFIELWNGRWQESGEYPSQSEADLALMSMLCFYSMSNEQCRRLFRMSQLGKRAKATKDDRYLDFTLTTIRSRQAREASVNRASESASAAYIERVRQQRDALAAAEVARLQGAALQADSAVAVGVAPATTPAQPPAPAVPAQLVPPPTPGALKGLELDWPPGMAGELAGFIYRNAHRPVKEVAIVATLGWLAGVCGKAWMIPGSGLNLYIILVARSAVGKEAMHSGLSVLTQSLLDQGYVAASRFIDYSDFASGPALRKAVALQTSFVNVTGEWGRKLRRLSQDSSHDGPMQSLRTEMTNLYQKSGPQSIVGGMMYSKKEDNVASTSGVNYSMIGETTPSTFYDALTETMMEDGFLSRFCIVEFSGERPPANGNLLLRPPESLLRACGTLTILAAQKIDAKTPTMVDRTPEAAAIMEAFDKESDAQVNRTPDEAWRQMWNRAQLKSLRIAALLAVADNPGMPCITAQHMQWAIDLVRRDIRVMARKIDDGEVGTGDATRERKIIAMCKEYLSFNGAPSGYGISDAMQREGIVPRKYFQIRTQRLTLFSQAKQGSIRALNEVLQSLCDSGYLMEMEKAKVSEAYGFQGRSYRIVHLPDGLAQ